MFFPPALIKYIRPVFVSRSDQDSRRKTVEEIKRRAQSNGKWPQVGCVCDMTILPDLLFLLRMAFQKWISFPPKFWN